MNQTAPWGKPEQYQFQCVCGKDITGPGQGACPHCARLYSVEWDKPQTTKG